MNNGGLHMNLFLKYIFLFFLGACSGWIMELFFRRIVHKKWVNPGFLMGPYLPIYGFGVCVMNILITLCAKLPAIITIILMGAGMTLIELIGGLQCLKDGLRLWDYRDRFLNYKGVICPLFSLIWTIICAIYYFFIDPYVMKALSWFENNLAYSFILGFLFCLIILDYIRSAKVISKIRAFAKENNIQVRLEEFKESVKENKEKRKEKYPFLSGFYKLEDLPEQLKRYSKNIEKLNIFPKKSKNQKIKGE